MGSIWVSLIRPLEEKKQNNTKNIK